MNRVEAKAHMATLLHLFCDWGADALSLFAFLVCSSSCSSSSSRLRSWETWGAGKLWEEMATMCSSTLGEMWACTFCLWISIPCLEFFFMLNSGWDLSSSRGIQKYWSDALCCLCLQCVDVSVCVWYDLCYVLVHVSFYPYQLGPAYQSPPILALLQSQMPINMDQLISLDQLISMDASGPGNGEYKEMAGKSCFFRPGAVDPAMEASGFQCSLFEESAGEFYQEHNCKTLPILTVKHPLFIS